MGPIDGLDRRIKTKIFCLCREHLWKSAASSHVAYGPQSVQCTARFTVLVCFIKVLRIIINFRKLFINSTTEFPFNDELFH